MKYADLDGTKTFFYDSGATFFDLNGEGEVVSAGKNSADFVSSGTITGGVTYLQKTNDQKYIQDSQITKIKVDVSSFSALDYIIVKSFTFNGVGYDYKSESDHLIITSDGINEFDISEFNATIGDQIAIYLSPTLTLTTSSIATADSIGSSVGDITTTDLFSTNISNFELNIEVSCTKPYFTVTGDSIAVGHNSPGYIGHLEGGPSGNINAMIMYSVTQLCIDNNYPLTGYQNMAMGGQTFAWVDSTGIVEATAMSPENIIIHCGINDVSQSRTWATIETNLNSIKSKSGGANLFIGEILPWTNGTDANAITIREFNINLSTWCINNGCSLIKAHDDMGQIRISTGELDDLYYLYDSDGTHLTQAGVSRMGELWLSELIPTEFYEKGEGVVDFIPYPSTTVYYNDESFEIGGYSVGVSRSFTSPTDVFIPDFPNVTVVAGDYTGELMPYLTEAIDTPITVHTFDSADIKDQVKLAELLTAKTIEIGINNFIRYVDYTAKQQLFGDLLYIQDNKIYFSDGTTTYNEDQIFTKGISYDIALVFQPTRWFITVNGIVTKIIITAPGTLVFPSTIGLPVGVERDTLKNIVVQESIVKPLQVIAEGGEYVVTDSGDNVVF